jgi:glucose dehydrogenase
MVGETNGDKGVRGFVRAFNETNGKLLWTFYTVPRAKITSSNQAFYKNSWGTNGTFGCECGGGAVWNVPAVDPNTGIIYFGTGNPYPGGSSVKIRTPVYPSTKYTNLYTDSIIALNSTNGKLIWFFQMVPGDQRDYDQGMPVQLFTTTIHGVSTQVVGAGSKIGYYFVVNAKTGTFIYKVKVGIHLNDNSTQGAVNSTSIYPGSDGGMDSFSAYNPMTNLVYTTAYNEPESCSVGALTGCHRNATFYAINASTGSIAWSKFMIGDGLGGGASTTNNVVFTAAGNNTFYAFNASNGTLLWSHHDATGGGLDAYWSWGAPSIVNGMVFETTMGNSSNGLLEAWIT